MLKKVSQFVIEAKNELAQVEWPARKEAIYLTLIVLGFSAILALYLGVFDILFAYLLRVFILQL